MLNIKLPTREEMLAKELPIEERRGRTVYRFANDFDRKTFLHAERRVLAKP